MPRKLRCAVIGVGGIGMRHLKHLDACPNAKVVAIAETNPKCIQDALAAVSIPKVYNDYRELLDQPDIDAVVNALPNYLHAPVSIDAMRAGKHVMVEKPMATNAADGKRMAKVAVETGRILMVGQNFRFNKHTQLVKRAMEKGSIGEVYHARGFWLRRSGIPRIGSWFTRQDLAGGGVTYDLGVHLLDTMFYLMGEFDVASVTGRIGSEIGKQGIGGFDWGKSEIDPAKPFTVDDFSVALIKMRSGRTVLLEVSWAGYFPAGDREHGIDLLGTRGALSLYPAKLFSGDLREPKVQELNATRFPYPESPVVHFVNNVLKGKPLLIQLNESLQVQRVLDGIYESSRTGREVVFDDGE